MLNKLTVIMLALCSGSVLAGQVFCQPGPGQVGVPMYSETIQIPEPGFPGLVFVGMTDPGKQSATVLHLDGTWGSYTGGLYPPFARYDAGLPSSVNVLVPLPVTDGTTDAIAGWSVYVGYGLLNQQTQQEIQTRRDWLNANKAKMVANGTWNADYDSDDRMKWALVQQDLTKNNKYHVSLTIPDVNCNPPQGGNGS